MEKIRCKWCNRNNPNMIRNRKKIEAAIHNIKIFRDIQKEWGTFSNYIWHFTDGSIIYETGKTSSALSDEISKDMKKRGMKFIGIITMYAYLQSIGVIYSHDTECFMYKDSRQRSDCLAVTSD